jgi:hypothetical protein
MSSSTQIFTWFHKLYLAIAQISLNFPIVISRDYVFKSKIIKQFTITSAQDLPLVDNNINAYEVLLEDTPRRFYIDLDLPVSNKLFSTTTVADMVYQAIDFVSTMIKEEFKLKLKLNETIILQVPNDTYKKSAHIIFPGIILPNATVCSQLVTILKFKIATGENELLKTVIDFAVYNVKQNFRMAYQTKYGKTVEDGYALIPNFNSHLGEFPTMDKYLVGIYGLSDDELDDKYSILPDLEKKMSAVMDKVGFKNVGRAEVGPVFDMWTNKRFDDADDADANAAADAYLGTNNSLIDLSKHTMYSQEAFKCMDKIRNSNKSPQSHRVWWSIGQALKNIEFMSMSGLAALPGMPADGAQSDFLIKWISWSNLASLKYPNEVIKCKAAWASMKVHDRGYKLTFLRSLVSVSSQAVNVSVQSPMDDLFKWCIEPTESVAESGAPSKCVGPYDFTNVDINVLEGHMGTGKTYQIFKLLEANPDLYKRVLIIASRRSFTNEKIGEFKKYLPGIKDYQDPIVQTSSDWYRFKQLVIQVESLHHLDGCENTYDLVICDESESVCFQFSSSTHSKLTECYSAFWQIFRRSKHLILADAFITNRTLKYAQSLGRPMSFKYKKASPNGHLAADILGEARSLKQLIALKRLLINHMRAALALGKKLCFACARRDVKDEILAALNLPESAVISYDSKKDDVLVRDLGNVKAIWANPLVRLVTYTTIISVGINFDTEDVFDNIYMYGSSRCPIARDLMQSHFRVRKPKDSHIYIAIDCCNYGSFGRRNLADIQLFHSSIENELNGTSGILAYENADMDRSFGLLAAHSALEQNIGYADYYAVFILYLKKIGYKIVYPIGKLVMDEDDDEPLALDPALALAALALVLNDHPYHTYKSTSDDGIAIITDLIKTSNATAVHKETSAAYHFYNGRVKDFCSIPLPAEVEKELFIAYYNNHTTKIQIDHIVMELTRDVKHVVNASKRDVKEKQKSATEFKFITEMCGIVGIANSFDTVSVIEDDALWRFKEYYLKNLLIADIFEIKIEMKPVDFKLRQCISVIAGMCRHWSGFTVKVMESNALKKTVTDNYKCKLVHKGKGHVGVYAGSLKTAEEIKQRRRFGELMLA